MESPEVGVAAAFGLASGQWLRGLVFLHSVPYRQPIRTRCPTCGAVMVRAACRDVLATAPLDGRCHLCRSPVGPTPGSVELVAGAVLVAVAWAAPSGWVSAAWTWTALLTVALAFIDGAVLRLPDVLTIAAGLGSLLLLIAAAVFTGSWGDLGSALVGAAALGALYLLPILSKTMGMGRGDGMLAVVVGLNLGWLGLDALVTATLATAAIAVAYTVSMLAARRLRASDHVPVGPFILLGALTAALRHAG